MKKLTTLEFTRLASQVLRLPLRNRQDLSKLLAESLADGQQRVRKPKPQEVKP